MQSFASPPPHPPTPQSPHPTKITHHNSRHTPKKGRNYRLYLRPFYPKNHRKGATIASPQEKFVKICANSWLKTTNTDSTNHTDFPLNPCNNFNHKFPQISTNNSSSNPLKIR